MQFDYVLYFIYHTYLCLLKYIIFQFGIPRFFDSDYFFFHWNPCYGNDVLHGFVGVWLLGEFVVKVFDSQ